MRIQALTSRLKRMASARSWRFESWTFAAVSLLAVVVLLMASDALLATLSRHERERVAEYQRERLDTVTRLIGSLKQDALFRLQEIAENPDLKPYSKLVFDSNGGVAESETFERWITPLYRGRGFVGYSLVSPDHTVVLALSRAYNGLKSPPEADHAITRALSTGYGFSQPIRSRFPIELPGGEAPAGTAYQLACARIGDANQSLGVLCLRTDPRLRLFPTLRAGWAGATGDVYVIDQSGRILSPGRFLEGKHEAAERQGTLVEAWARVPAEDAASSAMGAHAAGRATSGGDVDARTLPLTRIARELVDTHASVTPMFAGYTGPTGDSEIGIGAWLAEAQMGLIVEQQTAEVYADLELFRSGVIALSAIAVLLIVSLATLQWRGRHVVDARRAAERAARARAEFIAHVSHEIRTPLNGIIGAVYLAGRRVGDGPLRVHLQRIGSASEHLLAVITDILDFSRIEAGRLEVANAPFSLREMVDAVMDLLESRARDKNLTVSAEIDPRVPDALVGDRLRVDQILINFLNNAIKYTHAGGVSLQVTHIESSQQQVRVRFDVIDTGPGIGADQLKKLFLPFERALPSGSERPEGTGLGLAISRQLAGLMGGHVSATSTPGTGSTFTAELAFGIEDQREVEWQPPVRRTMAPHNPEGRRGTQDWHVLDGRRVLLVDDDDVNRDITRELLEISGMQVTAASNGAEALAVLESASVDLLLTDIHMPRMDGVELARRVRAGSRLSALPIAALTAGAGSDDEARCRDAGIDVLMLKPVLPAQLYATLAHVLASRRHDAVHPARGGQGPTEQACTETVPDSLACDARLPAQARTVLHALGQIDGLDVGAALSRLLYRGDVYVELIQRVLIERADVPAQFEDAVDAGDGEGAALLAHTTKSMLGAIGASRLARQCATLESNWHAGAVDRVALGAFCAEYAQLFDALRKVLRTKHNA